MKKLFNFLLIPIIAFGIGAYTWNLLLQGREQKLKINHYLHLAIRDLLAQPASERKAYLSDTPIFARASIRDGHSRNNDQYFYFEPDPNGAKILNISIEPGDLENMLNFNGFYVSLSTDGNLTDFGFHKP